MDQIKQIINAINLALFDRSVLACAQAPDLKEIFAISKRQNITAMVWEGLKKQDGSLEPPTVLEKHLELYTYQYLCQSLALEQLTAELNRRGCSFVLLKGSRMRQFYSAPHLRTSCDIDILTRESDETVHEIMTKLGYRFLVDGGTTLNYKLEPVVEVEMHRRLFDDRLEFSGYFNDVWERTLPTEGSGMERFLSEEDFYVYMIAHAAKHISRYGCGVRPLIDIYLYLHRAPERFDHGKAREILKKLNLLGFEERICALTKAWFETGVLSRGDEALTEFIFQNGVYGSARVTAAQRMRTSGNGKAEKRKRLLRHVCPPLKVMRPMYPRLLKCSVLLPVAWLLRWVRLLLQDRKKIGRVMDELESLDDAYCGSIDGLMKELQL